MLQLRQLTTLVSQKHVDSDTERSQYNLYDNQYDCICTVFLKPIGTDGVIEDYKLLTFHLA